MRCEQLDLLLQWGAEFKRATSQSSAQEKGVEDQVAFDVILGDLNFDNCSSGELTERRHSTCFHLHTISYVAHRFNGIQR